MTQAGKNPKEPAVILGIRGQSKFWITILVCIIFLPAVPSAPQNVISIVNETSLGLEWSPPQEVGGREDVVYNIICKSCGSGRGGCTRCGDNVQFVPRQLGLTDTRVHISDLLAHTQYTFEIQAVNGVSDQSPYSPHYASVNITTNQAGEANPAFYLKLQQLLTALMGFNLGRLSVHLYYLQLLILHVLGLFSAPSAVSIIHQVSRSPNSITLSWSQPNQPNGVILDYELQYYEKVCQWSWGRLIKGLSHWLIYRLWWSKTLRLLMVSDAEPGRMELISNKESDQHCSHSRLEAWNYLRLSSSSSDCCWIWTLQWQNVLPNHERR